MTTDKYVLLAYLILWAGVFTYLLYLGSRCSTLTAQIKQLVKHSAAAEASNERRHD